MSFDEQPDAPLHGECAAEIARLEGVVESLKFMVRRNMGYAPGDYQCKCVLCGEIHAADKRAVVCKACADNCIDAALHPERAISG